MITRLMVEANAAREIMDEYEKFPRNVEKHTISFFPLVYSCCWCRVDDLSRDTIHFLALARDSLHLKRRLRTLR